MTSAEYQVTPDNVAYLFEEIELSKFHCRSNPEAVRGVEVDGLTVLERGTRQVALFGDWITRDEQGRHHVHTERPTAQPSAGAGERPLP